MRASINQYNNIRGPSSGDRGSNNRLSYRQILGATYDSLIRVWIFEIKTLQRKFQERIHAFIPLLFEIPIPSEKLLLTHQILLSVVHHNKQQQQISYHSNDCEALLQNIGKKVIENLDCYIN